MLKFKKTLIVFLALMVSALFLDRGFHISIWLYICIIIGFSALLAYGSSNISSGFYISVLCSSPVSGNKIALTFDDGPDETVTPAILEVLKEHDIKAVFFTIGKKAEKNPGLIRKIDEEGHAVGSHSYSHHHFFDLFGYRKMIIELQKTEAILNKILNKKITMFRPPFGVTNPPLARAVKKMNYHTIGWSLRSKDTVFKDGRLFERVTKRLKPGDIILFHDTMAHTPMVLDKFIMFARENNYTFERADKLLNIEPYD